MVYRIALFLHVFGAIAIFFFTGVGILAMLRLRSARTIERVRDWEGTFTFLDRAMPLVTLDILGAGLYMVFTAWGWQTGWVDVALATLILISVLAVAVRKPRLEAVFSAARTASDGPLPVALRARAQDPVLWATETAMTTMTIGLVFLMTVKPELPVAVLVIALTGAAGVVLGRRLARPADSRQPTAAHANGAAASRVA